MRYSISYLVSRSTLLQLVVPIYPLVGLVYSLVALVCLLVVLVCPPVVSACPLVVFIWPFVSPLVVLVVLSVSLFITDPFNDNKMIILMNII